MTAGSSSELWRKLRVLGLSDRAITAAWPRWWSEEAETSASARAELRFSVARRLGLDPESLLLDDESPRFMWREEARFKHLAGETEEIQAGITSFGRAVSALLVRATAAPQRDLAGLSAAELRASIVASREFVGLADLLAVAWACGVPVIHLRVFPWPQKRMAAMTARVGERSAVLLGKDAVYPPWTAFYLAHEIGHIVLGHVPADGQIVDLDEEDVVADPGDDEEAEADGFALELLTGQAEPIILPTGDAETRGAALAVRAAPELSIEPGTLALCFGHATGDWGTAAGALPHIYDRRIPVWRPINALARDELETEALSQESVDFLDAILGGEPE
jgi:hypothetical protein